MGLLAAEVLRETYKIPYVIGTPNQWLAEDISNALETTIMRHAAAIQQSATAQQATVIEQSVVVQQSDSAAFYLKNRMQQSAEITLIGEPVTMGSLAAGIEKIRTFGPRILSVERMRNTAWQKDKAVFGEEAMEEALKDARIIVADPLYRPVCPKDSIFYELPHVAFSGRIYSGKNNR